jgi:hypothetical protein
MGTCSSGSLQPDERHPASKQRPREPSPKIQEGIVAASAGGKRVANKLEVLQGFGEPSAGLGSAAVSFVGLAVAERKSLISLIIDRMPDPSCCSELFPYNDSPITFAGEIYTSHNTVRGTRNHPAGVAATRV